jgi:beta-galactosidase
MVHICGKRYVDRVEDVTKVTVYSNCKTVELFANGVSLGVQEHNGLPFFYFDVPNVGKTKLLAVAGECRDESLIRKVETPNEAYRLKEKGAILNWFDVTEVEGYLSLNSKMGDVLKTQAGQQLFMSLMGSMSAGKDGKVEAMGFQVTPEMMTMMNGFTVLRLLTLMGGMMNADFTKEQLLGMNAQLNMIKAD